MLASAGNAVERRTFLKVFNKCVHIVEILSEHVLLVFLRSNIFSWTATVVAVGRATSSIEWVGKLAGTSLRAGHGNLGHEVKIQELEQLDFDVLRGILVFEKTRNCEQAVHALECSCVLRRCQERCDEHEEGLRLYGGAVVGIEKVEEDVHVDFPTEDDA